MDINNESVFTIDELTKETMKCVRLRGWRIWLFIGLIIMSMGFGIAGLVYAIVKSMKITDFIVILVCLFIILLMLLYFLIYYPKAIKKNYIKTFKDYANFRYVFHINRFECYTNTENSVIESKFNYDELYKAVEDNGVLRVYIAKRNFLPVKIDKFENTDYDKIKKALKNSKGGKFKFIEK